MLGSLKTVRMHCSDEQSTGEFPMVFQLVETNRLALTIPTSTLGEIVQDLLGVLINVIVFFFSHFQSGL